MTLSRRDLISIAPSLVILAGAASAMPRAPAGSEARPPSALSVADCVETARIVDVGSRFEISKDQGVSRIRGSGVVVSPNGEHYAVMLIRGDLKRSGNWAEIIGGTLGSLEQAANCRTLARLFTYSEGEGSDSSSHVFPARLTFHYDNELCWIDNDWLGLRWVDSNQTIQVVTVNGRQGGSAILTRHPSHVQAWGVSSRGDILYSAAQDGTGSNRKQTIERGFSVSNIDAYSLISGYVEERRERRASELWLVRAEAAGRGERVLAQGKGISLAPPRFDICFSPDGRRAVVTAVAPQIPQAWSRYLGSQQRVIREALRNPAGRAPGFVAQHYVVDVERGTARPLWDAPAQVALTSARVLWSPDSRSVIAGPAYLPLRNANADGLNGASVAEVDVETGDFRTVPLSAPQADDTQIPGRLMWLTNEELVFDNGRESVKFQRYARRWIASRSHVASGPQTTVRGLDGVVSKVRIEVRQDMNTPPVLVAVDLVTRAERTVLDPNPLLTETFSLGRAEPFEWTDRDGRNWRGRLYYPVRYSAGRRYPAVLSTHGIPPPDEFSLYGHGFPLGPNYGISIAQPLANRDIAVLQIEDKTLGTASKGQGEAAAYMMAYETAVDRLVDSGLAMRDKIGLMGFSRTGWHVEYALTHSAYPFAAAVVADNTDQSYIQSTLSENQAAIGETYGVPPFGKGLELWYSEAPGFNADKIRAPLQMHSHSLGLAGVLGHWEIFSRLRSLKRAVELYVIPNIDRGSHGIQNPAQCQASQERAADWLDYWLNGREWSNPDKAAQYVAWRKLRVLHEEFIKGS